MVGFCLHQCKSNDGNKKKYIKYWLEPKDEAEKIRLLLSAYSLGRLIEIALSLVMFR